MLSPAPDRHSLLRALAHTTPMFPAPRMTAFAGANLPRGAGPCARTGGFLRQRCPVRCIQGGNTERKFSTVAAHFTPHDFAPSADLESLLPSVRQCPAVWSRHRVFRRLRLAVEDAVAVRDPAAPDLLAFPLPVLLLSEKFPVLATNDLHSRLPAARGLRQKAVRRFENAAEEAQVPFADRAAYPAPCRFYAWHASVASVELSARFDQDIPQIFDV